MQTCVTRSQARARFRLSSLGRGGLCNLSGLNGRVSLDPKLLLRALYQFPLCLYFFYSCLLCLPSHKLNRLPRVGGARLFGLSFGGNRLFCGSRGGLERPGRVFVV
jgi:hypothetical protein